MKGACVGVGAGFAALHQERAKLMMFCRFVRRLPFRIEYANDLLIFDDENFTRVLADEFVLVGEVVTEFRFQRERRVHALISVYKGGSPIQEKI
jgi:hypothetical protein